MPAADGTDVVLAPLAGATLARIVVGAWDAGQVVVPVDPRLPVALNGRLIEQLRPMHLHDGDGRRRLTHGVPGLAAIVATSGTTGAPKGVELTREGMEVMGRGYAAALAAGQRDRWLACMPLHHVASLGAVARAYVTGASYTVHDGFDLDRVGRSPSTEGSTIVSLVPTTLRRLLDARAPLHQFRRVIVGAAPCPPGLWRRAVAHGVPVVDAYGLSETWSAFTIDEVLKQTGAV